MDTIYEFRVHHHKTKDSSVIKKVCFLRNARPGVYHVEMLSTYDGYAFSVFTAGGDIYAVGPEEFFDGVFNIRITDGGPYPNVTTVRREHATSILALYNLTKKLIGYRDDRYDLD